MFRMPFAIQTPRATLRIALRLFVVLAVLSMAMADPAMAKRGGNGNGNGGKDGDGDGGSGEETPVEPTGITHVVYFIGFAFFPNQVHVEKGDTLMFTNLTNQNQMVAADDSSWSSGWLGYGGTYPILLTEDTDFDFTGTTYYSYGRNTYSYSFAGEATETPLEPEASPGTYPYLATSLAETFNITEAVRRIEKTRALVYTVDENGNVVSGSASN